MHLEHSPRPETAPCAQSPRVPHLIRTRLGIGVVLAVVVSGCAATPFVDSRREAGQTTPVGASTPERVAVCYSSSGTTPQAVINLAQAECAKTGRRAQFDGQDEMRCALLAPTRAFFKCVAR
jgi:hypothetical protein